MSWPMASGRFALGDLVLSSGRVLPGATLSWKTHGTLSPARDNVVLYPTSYGARHMDQEWLIGPDGILDPGRWFVVIPDMFTNGLSSSPSNTPDWPGLVTTHDNIHAQRRLLKGIHPVTALWWEPRLAGDLSDRRTSVAKVRSGFLDGDHHRG